MVWIVIGIALGGYVGWFSYQFESWFLDILASVCAGVAAFIKQTLPFFFKAAAPATGAYASTQSLIDAMPDLEPGSTELAAAEAALPVWTRAVMAMPHAVTQIACAALLTGIMVRIAMHVHATCYADEPAPETREQLRARLRAEMKYTDTLLD